MRSRFATLFLFLLGCLDALATTQTAAGLLDEANRHYRSGRYEQAAALYEQAIKERESAELYYNLANARYQLGQYGPAVLNYLRSEVCKPGDPDNQHNLKKLLEEARLRAPEQGLFQQLAHLLSANHWGWMAAGAFWIGLSLALYSTIFGKRLFWASLPFLLIFLIAKTALIGWHMERDFAVIQLQDSPLKKSPTSESPIEAYLDAGEIVVAAHTERNHWLVETAAGRQGWVERDALERLLYPKTEIPIGATPEE